MSTYSIARLTGKSLPLAVLLSLAGSIDASAKEIERASRLNPSAVEIQLSDGNRLTVDFYGVNIARIFLDPAGGILRDPKADPEAQILVDQPRVDAGEIKIDDSSSQIILSTEAMSVSFDKESGLMTVKNLTTGQDAISGMSLPQFGDGNTTVTLSASPTEYFYGGGVQNGRFSHRGRKIAIENQNSWTDGGVASPTPFYWSTSGYGIMWYTFAPGEYDFGKTSDNTVALSHATDYFDIFIMVDESPVAILNDFYQLTGNPVLLPKFGFYEGHLNAYNRDYWTPDTTGILFEDGKRYKEGKKVGDTSVKESLNGELDNYQFSARAVVDRYSNADMPLGWVLPNDGYGAGYGQTGSLDGNVANLKEFGDYARSKGVEIGLWTQSDLHPKEGIEPLLQRDIVKEVRDAGVRVLKTDVAWVGWGYSFGLNGVADVGQIMPYYGNNARPFIISLDGWAGTQRYAGIWTGDQTGGVWEYIRFHIPTYIGSGLSGQPNISSDMDGIFGGKNPIVNIRDFQWKTFSPMQLNMDGWGANEKYPQALGEPATSINRSYLKLKSQLLPYTYTYAREAVDGMPLIRAMMLDYPNRYTLGTATRYQYMFGPDFLVAPIYQNTGADAEGNDIRNGIYLPEGSWIDFFSGEKIEGGRIINNFDAPLWKLPVFVRSGAIIPLANPNNNPSEIDKNLRIYMLYPDGFSEMTEYDDDGETEAYRNGMYMTTRITSDVTAKGDAVITVDPSEGTFKGFSPDKATEFIVNLTKAPRDIEVAINGKKVKLTHVDSREALDSGENVWYYDPAPQLNRFATEGTPFAELDIVSNPRLYVRLAPADITGTTTRLTVKGYEYATENTRLRSHGQLSAPEAGISAENIKPYSLTPSWNKVDNADYYEIRFDDMVYSTITSDSLEFADLTPETDYTFSIRSVNADGASQWSDFSCRTADDPLQFAIRGIEGICSAPDQEGFEVYRLFDFVESGDTWHTKYQHKALPFSITMKLPTVNEIDRFTYVPRADGGNGIILQGSVETSGDGIEWTPAGEFTWDRNNDPKTFSFTGQPRARYIRLNVSNSVGSYGSGSEIYVFKVPGTESFLPGDINLDGVIDENDLTSYANYTGLRKGDSDFEGYISGGDVNGNGLIDAYDISNVTTCLGTPVKMGSDTIPLTGDINVVTTGKGKARSADDRKSDEYLIYVDGKNMCDVNALSLEIEYDAAELEYIGTEAPELEGMRNLTYDRLHTDGSKALYPTFANIGEAPTLSGDRQLMLIRFRPLVAAPKAPVVRHRIIVSPSLKSIEL